MKGEIYMTIDLTKLSEPFPPDDIEWRVARAGIGGKGVFFCLVIPYITARAIQKRLDDVCGPENWRNEETRVIDVNGKCAFAGGISIWLCRPPETASPLAIHNSEWVTKWDVADPTNIEPAKGGFSGAMKRAGAQWGIGRYLYYLDETFAEVEEKEPVGSRSWNWAKLPKDKGGREYWWKATGLPAWALPMEAEHEIHEDDLNTLKKAWRAKFAPEVKNPKDLRNGFAQFVTGVVGEFPIADAKCWTRQSLEKCQERINATTDPGGVSSDVPFE